MEQENVTRFFYFADEINQAMFEKQILDHGFRLVQSCKIDYPTDKPFSTIVDRMEDADSSLEDDIALCKQLEDWAKVHGGHYDGHETQFDIDPEDIEDFLASLPLAEI